MRNGALILIDRFAVRRGQNVCCRGDPGELYLYHQPSALLGHHQHHQHHQQASDYSGPPSYRSRASTLRPGCHLMDPAAGGVGGGPAVIGSTAVSSHHSRNPSQLSAASEAVGGGGGAVTGGPDAKVPPPPADDDHDDRGGNVVRNIVVVDEKTDHIGCGPVTIVQTTPAANAPGTVIVTVSSANNDATNVRCRENEMEILAHL